MSEKRRRARVQGGWASTSENKSTTTRDKLKNKSEKSSLPTEKYKFQPTIEVFLI